MTCSGNVAAVVYLYTINVQFEFHLVRLFKLIITVTVKSPHTFFKKEHHNMKFIDSHWIEIVIFIVCFYLP